MSKYQHKVFFYSLTLPSLFPLGASCSMQANIIYFSTQDKLERWQKKNPSLDGKTDFGMHEIAIDVCKDLIKLSKKKPKCCECGK